MNARAQQKRLASEAAQWVIRLDTDTSADGRTAFHSWLTESPAHIRAFLETNELTVQLGQAPQGTGLDWDALRADVHGNVLPWQQPDTQAAGELQLPQSETLLRSSPRMGPGRVAIAAVLTLVCIMAMLGALTLFSRDPVYSTDVGEQRAIKLPDGSVVTLNTRSRLAVHFTHVERHLDLLDGEALFAVAPDPARPFRVTANQVTVQALGTQFNIYRHAGVTTVAVIDGRVWVEESRGNQLQSSEQLAAGEEAHVAGGGAIVKHPLSDRAAPVAWRARRLVFQETPLGEVAAQFNRYNRTQIVVSDDFGEGEKLTGGFDADNLPALLLFLQRDPNLTVDRVGDTVHVRKRHDDASSPAAHRG